MGTKTLAIVGCGKLAKIIVKALKSGLLEDYTLIATYSRTFEKAKFIADYVKPSETGYECKPCKSVNELLTFKPDYIVETASPDAMRALAIPALENGSNIVTLSIGAFADGNFYNKVKEIAKINNTRVYVASGAIGGLDVMRTVSLMENCTGTFDTEKGPNSLKNTPVYDDKLQFEKRKVFEGNAKEAIALFPTRVNVAVAASIASVGPKDMKVSMTSIPGFVGDRHRIQIKSEQVEAVVDVYSKTAQIAGWSVVNTLRNITSPIVF